jgi:hypothetical protein
MIRATFPPKNIARTTTNLTLLYLRVVFPILCPGDLRRLQSCSPVARLSWTATAMQAETLCGRTARLRIKLPQVCAH